MVNAASQYFDKTIALLEGIRDTQMEQLEAAAEVCANAIAHQGLVFMFGAGHSRMMCEEMTPRQGCFVGWVALVELALSNHASIIGANGLRTALHLEKYESYAGEILKSFRFGPHDVLWVISTSGIRPVIVEMALGARERGLPVIALCSRQHCEQAPSGHSSGKKLIDVADVLLDNQCPPGDCVIPLEGVDWRTGPTSTVTGAMIINMVRARTAEKLLERGHQPVLLPSHQFVGNQSAAEQLDRFYEAYRRSLAHLYE